jgi:quercetin dioxygenase-like cupin family protein
MEDNRMSSNRSESERAAQSRPQPFIVRNEEGTHLWTMGMLMTIKASASQTNGEFSVMEARLPAGAAPPLHVHHHEAEINYVIDGRIRFQCGDVVRDCGPGDFVFLPKDTPHSFRAGPDGGRMLGIVAPAGLDELYAQVGEAAEELKLPDKPPNVARWLELAPKYSIEVVGPPVE